MRRATIAALFAVVVAGFAPASGNSRAAPEFRGSVEKLSPKLRDRMTGVSWHRGCPVGLADLRLIRTSHRDFEGRASRGTLVVHEDHAREILAVFKRLWATDFPIRRLEPIDRYGGSDHASMAADNTSAFNCRVVAGTDRWSMHAYGLAIDINPRENPYVSGGHVSPPEGAPFVDRSDRRPGMLFARDPAVRAMRRIAGWEWGGKWSGPIDYQHFSANGG